MHILLYSHDSFGLGSARRQLAIADALARAQPDAKLLMATSARETHGFPRPTGLEILDLPHIRRADNGEYVSTVSGLTTTALAARRSELLMETVATFRPTVVVIDKHPFGLLDDMAAPIAAAKSQGARIVFGLRDILDAPGVVRRQWAASCVQERMIASYDLVLVYGDRRIFDPVEAYALKMELAARTQFCGYVLNRMEPSLGPMPEAIAAVRQRREGPVVVATTGGGSDGATLIETFLAAADHRSWSAVAVAGPLSPSATTSAHARQAASNRVPFHIFLPEMQRVIGAADVLVCMGGYNTLAEALASGTPIVCVPRLEPRTEQLMRATAFSQLGLVEMIMPAELTAPRLAERIEFAMGRQKRDLRERAQSLVSFNGAANAAVAILTYAGSCNRSPSSLIVTP